MTAERDPRREAAVPEESGTVADIGAISATDSLFDCLGRGDPLTCDDPAVRMLAGLSHDVRAVPPPPAWRTDTPEESPARPGRAVRLGRRTALTGVGTVAVSVLCAVGVAAATGVDPVSALTQGRVHLTPPPAVTSPRSPGKPRSAEPGEHPKRSGAPAARPSDTTGPANPHQHPPGKAKGWTHGHGHGNGRDNGNANGPGSDNGKHKGQAKGNGKAGGATPAATADARTTAAPSPAGPGEKGPAHDTGPTAGTHHTPPGHSRSGHHAHPHDHGPEQGK